MLAGEDVQRLYRAADGKADDFSGAVPDPAVVAEAWAAWRAAVDFSDQFASRVADLGFTARFSDGLGGESSISLRSVLVHLIGEYARHLGHADFLRERIDGRVGQ